MRSCFRRWAWSRGKRASSCDKEYEAARKAGAAVERLRGVPLKGFETAPVAALPRPGDIPSAQISQRPGRRDPGQGRTALRQQRGDEDRRTRGQSARRDRRWRHDRSRACGVRHQFADQRPRGAAQQDGAVPHLCDGLHHCPGALCPTRSTGTWPIPITMSASIPARARSTI